MDKITCNFIWAGDDIDTASGGHSLVNEKTVCRPEVLGGLGIADLERLEERSDYSGFGFSGTTLNDHGPDHHCPAMLPTSPYFELP